MGSVSPSTIQTYRTIWILKERYMYYNLPSSPLPPSKKTFSHEGFILFIGKYSLYLKNCICILSTKKTYFFSPTSYFMTLSINDRFMTIYYAKRAYFLQSFVYFIHFVEAIVGPHNWCIHRKYYYTVCNCMCCLIFVMIIHYIGFQ